MNVAGPVKFKSTKAFLQQLLQENEKRAIRLLLSHSFQDFIYSLNYFRLPHENTQPTIPQTN